MRKSNFLSILVLHFLPLLPLSSCINKQYLESIGKIRPRSTCQIASSPISIGGETLDRDYADYHQYKKYLGPLGAKKIRLQAGWAKTEKEKGVYNWEWLDSIIDDVVSQQVAPWLQTSYGNPIYEGGGAANLGGGIPSSPEALEAWDNWVRSMAKRYRDKVKIWEVWNESDHGSTKDPTLYLNLFIRTTEIVRKEIPDARIYALSIAGPYETGYAEAFLKGLRQQGKLDLVDEITFHGYVYNPSDAYEKLKPLKKLVTSYDPNIKLHQGEQGCPSTYIKTGALRKHPWTETSQAKWALRRLLGDLGNGYQTLYFQMADMNYGNNTTTHIKGVNTKGLLRTNTENQVLYAKPSYYAVQNLCAIMDSTFTHLDPGPFRLKTDSSYSIYGFEQNNTGYQYIGFWLDGEVPADSYPYINIDIDLKGITIENPVLIDLLSGEVFALRANSYKQNDEGMAFFNIPVYDSPRLIAEKQLIGITTSETTH